MVFFVSGISTREEKAATIVYGWQPRIAGDPLSRNILRRPSTEASAAGDSYRGFEVVAISNDLRDFPIPLKFLAFGCARRQEIVAFSYILVTVEGLRGA